MSASEKKTSLSGKSLDYRVPEGIGLKFGPNSEFTLLFKVKPGHADQLRVDIKRFGDAVKDSDIPAKVGLHESRMSMCENDTRMLFSTTFDGDINIYLDDAVFLLQNILHWWLRHMEGYPGTMDSDPPDYNEYKEWFMTHFRMSTTYFRLYPRTAAEILKALKVNEAFQKVLDNPASHKALHDPALKPLLDLASE